MPVQPHHKERNMTTTSTHRADALTPADDKRVREARAILHAAGTLPKRQSTTEARKGLGANPAFITVNDRYSKES